MCLDWLAEARKKALAKRRAALLERFSEEDVDRIMNQVLWKGETAEMLIESIGRPLSIDQKVLKTRVKEVWKYAQLGHRRYATRITLEDGVVIGWDVKSK